MAKLSPEKQALRTERFKATMKAKMAAQRNKPKSVAEREAQELYGLEPVTAADIMAAKPLAMAKALPKNDVRVVLAREIVRLLERVLA